MAIISWSRRWISRRNSSSYCESEWVMAGRVGVERDRSRKGPRHSRTDTGTSYNYHHLRCKGCSWLSVEIRFRRFLYTLVVIGWLTDMTDRQTGWLSNSRSVFHHLALCGERYDHHHHHQQYWWRNEWTFPSGLAVCFLVLLISHSYIHHPHTILYYFFFSRKHRLINILTSFQSSSLYAKLGLSLLLRLLL